MFKWMKKKDTTKIMKFVSNIFSGYYDEEEKKYVNIYPSKKALKKERDYFIQLVIDKRQRQGWEKMGEIVNESNDTASIVMRKN